MRLAAVSNAALPLPSISTDCETGWVAENLHAPAGYSYVRRGGGGSKHLPSELLRGDVHLIVSLGQLHPPQLGGDVRDVQARRSDHRPAAPRSAPKRGGLASCQTGAIVLGGAASSGGHRQLIGLPPAVSSRSRPPTGSRPMLDTSVSYLTRTLSAGMAAGMAGDTALRGGRARATTGTGQGGSDRMRSA